MLLKSSNILRKLVVMVDWTPNGPVGWRRPVQGACPPSNNPRAKLHAFHFFSGSGFSPFDRGHCGDGWHACEGQLHTQKPRLDGKSILRTTTDGRPDGRLGKLLRGRGWTEAVAREGVLGLELKGLLSGPSPLGSRDLVNQIFSP